MKGLLFTIALTYGGAVASLFNPFIGLLIYVCFAIIKPQSLWYWSGLSGNYSRIIAIALLLGWMFKGCGNWRFGRGRAAVWALIGFLAWSALSATVAPNRAVAWDFVENMSKIVLPVVVGATLIDSIQKVQQLAWTIALSQGYVAYDLNQAYYDGFNRLQQTGFGSLDNNSVAIAMVAGIGLAFFLGLGASRWWQKIIAFGAAGLMTNAVMFSFSRGGVLSLMITVGFAFALIPKQRKHYVALAVASMVVIRLAGPQVVARFATVFVAAEERDASAQSRLDLWADCWDAMSHQPVFGVGPDHWPLVVERYGWPPGKEAHTLWLQIGAELGLPGIAFLASFYVYCLWRLWPMRRSGVYEESLVGPARMVIASLVGFMVSAQFVSLEGLELPYYVGLLGVGVLKLADANELGPLLPSPADGWASRRIAMPGPSPW